MAGGKRSVEKTFSAEKLVAEAVHRNNKIRIGGICFDFLAQLQNVIIDRARGGIFVNAPNFFEQLVAAHGIAAK